MASTFKPRPRTTGKPAMPKNISPMLATLVDTPPQGDDWKFEIKWDGYRALAYLDGSGVDIRSRNNKSFNEKFYPVYDALRGWKVKAVVDGEIVVINEMGHPDFSNLQGWRSEADGQLAYYIFDVLWWDGKDLTNDPLEKRYGILQDIAPKQNDVIRISEQFETSGREFFALAEKLRLEGIFAKKTTSLYFPGIRSKEWLKIKTEKRQEFVIGGYTQNENSNKLFSALLVGVYEGKEFHFVTPVGTGFSIALQKE
ncbi:MAG TPA: DNA ligase D, partial [Chitinophagaceae bacterium]